MVNAILSTSRRHVPSLAQAMAAGAMNFKDQHKEHSDFVEEDHKDATNQILGFLYSRQIGFLKPLPCGFKTDEKINFWSQKMRDQNLLPNSAPSPTGSNLGPSDDAISKLASGVTNLNTILENHLLTHKSAKENKFETLNSESKVMIKNASSKSTEFSATGPTESLD